MHGYYESKINNDTQIEKHLEQLLEKDEFMISELENCLSTIQHQELRTKYLKNKRARDSGKTCD